MTDRLTQVTDLEGGLRAGIEHHGGETHVVLAGELDLATHKAFERFLTAVERCDERPIVVDLARLDFLDAAGLGALVRAKSRRGGGRRPVSMVGAPRAVRRLLEVTSMMGLLRAAAADDGRASTG